MSKLNPSARGIRIELRSEKVDWLSSGFSGGGRLGVICEIYLNTQASPYCVGGGSGVFPRKNTLRGGEIDAGGSLPATAPAGQCFCGGTSRRTRDGRVGAGGASLGGSVASSRMLGWILGFTRGIPERGGAAPLDHRWGGVLWCRVGRRWGRSHPHAVCWQIRSQAAQVQLIGCLRRLAAAWRERGRQRRRNQSVYVVLVRDDYVLIVTCYSNDCGVFRGNM